jgi:hypothetical protein
MEFEVLESCDGSASVVLTDVVVGVSFSGSLSG